MGWIMVLFAIAVGGLLIWQNLGVITLVFFGGIMTVKLPLAVWPHLPDLPIFKIAPLLHRVTIGKEIAVMIGILMHPPKNRLPFRIGKNSRLGLLMGKKRILSSLQRTVIKLAQFIPIVTARPNRLAGKKPSKFTMSIIGLLRPPPRMKTKSGR